MDWNRGYVSSYYAMIVDSQSWQDEERVDIIDGGMGQEALGLRQSADLTVSRAFDSETYLRVYLLATQGSEKVRVPLFTGLVISPSKELNGRVETHKLECYSVLKPCADIYLPRGWYAPASISCENMIRTLLDTTPAPIHIAQDVPSLTEAIVAEDDETCLSMADKILLAIGWQMRINGDGNIAIQPQSTEVVSVFGADGEDVLEPQLTVSDDWYDAPNVFRAISDDLTAVARDDVSETPISVLGRGREVWMQEANVNLNDGESIEEYAVRRLKEEQRRKKTVSYKRRYKPDVGIGDMIRLRYPEQKIDGVYRVLSQDVAFDYSCQTSEEVEEI